MKAILPNRLPTSRRNAEGDRSKQPMKIAERLRFVHVGQRARAETIVQQRQPGLVESLIAQQIRVHSYQPEFCRTLFQLMVPQDFKDAARQLDRIVLVLDGYTRQFALGADARGSRTARRARAHDQATLVKPVSAPSAPVAAAARLRDR